MADNAAGAMSAALNANRATVVDENRATLEDVGTMMSIVLAARPSGTEVIRMGVNPSDLEVDETQMNTEVVAKRPVAIPAAPTAKRVRAGTARAPTDVRPRAMEEIPTAANQRQKPPAMAAEIPMDASLAVVDTADARRSAKPRADTVEAIPMAMVDVVLVTRMARPLRGAVGTVAPMTTITTTRAMVGALVAMVVEASRCLEVSEMMMTTMRDSVVVAMIRRQSKRESLGDDDYDDAGLLLKKGEKGGRDYGGALEIEKCLHTRIHGMDSASCLPTLAI